jgi:hypothetical protein
VQVPAVPVVSLHTKPSMQQFELSKEQEEPKVRLHTECDIENINKINNIM